MELPADDGDLEDGPGARRGERPDPEAVRADAALAPTVRRSSRRRSSPPGVLQVVTGDGVPVGERIVAHPDVAPRLAHRRRRHRQDDRAHRRRHAQARPPRARRQGADGRLRRRRPEGGRRGDPARRLLELGPGLHRRLARDRRPEDLRHAARRARAAGRVAQGRRPARATRPRWAPSISQEQQERILGFLERAKGATILTGGGTNGAGGYFVQPTLVTDVKQDDEIVQKRGLRAGRDGAALRGRRRGDPLGERRPATGSPRRSGRATSAAR